MINVRTYQLILDPEFLVEYVSLMGILALIYAYVLGGLTFIPIILIGFVYLHPTSEKKEEKQEKLKAGEIEELHQSGLDTYHSGWITVTQDYLYSLDELSSSTQPITDSSDSKSAYSSLYKLIQKETNGSGDQSEPINKLPPEKVKSSHKKHRFFAILKHGNLFLYKNEKLTDVKHVVVLSNQIVTIWPPGLSDGQLFSKQSAICLMKRDWSRNRRLSDNFGEEKITISDVLDKNNDLDPPKGSIFIYCDINTEKEDWYFALIRSSKSDGEKVLDLDPNIYAKTLHFETSSMIDLIQTLYSSEGQLETKWLNAIIGRVFLSLQKTDILKSYLQKKIEKKLDKIKKPGFLDTFQIKELYTGDSAPFITYPKLKEINPDGSVIVSSYIHYHGNLSMKFATKMNINLGSRFKTREVDVVLNITFGKLEGPTLIKIKPPPSGRLWYTFEIMPTLELKIEPIVSSRQMNYNIITNQIEKKFKDAIKDSLVLPHWDDFVFSDTTDEVYRGGIWEKQTDDTSSISQNSTSQPQNTSPKPFTDSELNSLVESSIEVQNQSPQQENFLTSDSKLGSASTSKQRLTNTISDLSKKIKKQKSSHTIGVTDHQYLSDGTFIEPSNKGEVGEKKNTINTLKKIGKWYFKDGPPNAQQENYTPPDMIVNRRLTRKPPPDLHKEKEEDMEANSEVGPLYDFAKFPEEVIVAPSRERTNTISSGYSLSSIDNISINAMQRSDSTKVIPSDDTVSEKSSVANLHISEENPKIESSMSNTETEDIINDENEESKEKEDAIEY